MAAGQKPPMTDKDVRGLKYFKTVGPLLAKLHAVGTERDRAGNRKLFFDQHAALILLYFFNPVLTSLRGIQQASGLKRVQRRLGCAKTSLGSLSEANQVFDAEALKEVIAELASRLPKTAGSKEAEALKNLTAVDGSLLPALPKMVWALWRDEEHRAAKLHLQFDVFKGAPIGASVTNGNASEKQQLRQMLQAGRLYVLDRGYAQYRLFQDILDAGSSFIGRIRNNAKWTVIEERPVSAAASRAGVRRDLVVRIGGAQTSAYLRQPVRIVEVATTNSKGEPIVLLLATDRMDLDAELVALGYRSSWSVELFFRWLKCVLGCRHLISNSENGVKIQVYLALIASLLISLWTEREPTKRTFEMLCFYFSGWASEEELLAHVARLKK